MRNITKKLVLVSLICVFGFSFFNINITNYQGNFNTKNKLSKKEPISSEVEHIYTLEGNIYNHIWSPDGTKLAYAKSPSGQLWNLELWVAEKDPYSANLYNHQLISSELDSWGGLCDWKDDWILYRIRREEGTPATYYGRNELWKIRYDGTGQTQVTFTQSNGIGPQGGTIGNTGGYSGYFIPGTNLVYFHANTGGGWPETYVCNDDGTDGWYSISNPDNTWRYKVSPTGDRLFWGKATYFRNPTTFKSCNVDGSDWFTIKAFTADINPTILADGKTAVWVQNDILYAIETNGTNERTILDDGNTNIVYGYDPSDTQVILLGSNRSDGNMHIFKIQEDGTGVEQLSEGPYMDEVAHLSPDGNYLSYMRLPEDFDKGTATTPYPYELVVKSLSPANIYTIGGNISDHLWSPDGTKVAYVQCPLGELWNCELWVAEKEPNGVQLINHQLISSEMDYRGLLDWKDDWILYRIRREEGTPSTYYGRGELWKIRYDGTGMTQVTFTQSNGIGPSGGTIGWTESAYFIPGTNLVYFHANTGGGWWQTFVCNDDGTDGWYPISAPDYTWRMNVSPTGNKLLWGRQSSFGQPTTTKSCNVDGSDRATIKVFSSVIAPRVLADGNTVVWSENENLYAIDMDGTNERTILDDENTNLLYDYDPSDEQGLLMASNRSDGNQHAFKIKVDGTGIEQLTEGPYLDEFAILSPDGNYLSYRRLPDDFDKDGAALPYPYELVVKKASMSIEVNFPTPNQLCGIIAPSFSLTIDAADVQEKWYSFNGGDNITFTSEGQFSQLEWDKLDNGTVLITFYAKDHLDTIISAEVTVRKDAILPDITILSPIADEFFGNISPDFDVSITEEDLKSAWYIVEGTITEYSFVGEIGLIDQGAWDDALEGDVTITFYVEDSAGNINTAEVTVKKDAILPDITILSPTENYEFFNTSPDFSLSIIEENLYSAWYTIEGDTTEYSFIGSTGTIDQVAWDNLDNGSVTIAFCAQDKAGNIGMETVTILKSSPSTTEDPGFKISGYNLLVLTAILGIISIILNKHVKSRRS